MTLSEFKAWFEGFTEGMDGAPTEKQFKRIKAKVAEINGAPITQTVYVERYRDYFRWPNWPNPYISYSAGSAPAALGVGNCVMADAASSKPALDFEWDSHAAMYAVGKSEALAS